MFIFHGGVISTQDIKSIQLRQDELSESGFFTAETLPFDMTGSLRNRILADWHQAANGKGIYLENQEPL